MVKTLTRSTPHVGELLTFNVIVANQGPSPATGVAVTDVLSAGLTFEEAAPSQGSYDDATGVWTVGALANGDSAGLTITARVTQAGTVTNTASVTASDQPDPDPADNTSSVTVTTETIADLTITKTLTGSPVPGLPITYTIVVTNTGPSPVTAASVTDVFPIVLVAPTWTCVADTGSSCAAASGTGNLATTVSLEAGDRATFTVNGLIASSATGLLVNTATVTAPAGAVDPDLANNTATSSVTLAPSAALQITKAGPRQRGGRDEYRLHDHRHECGTLGCHRCHGCRSDAPRPDVRRRTPGTARRPSRAISARCPPAPPARSRRRSRSRPAIRRPIRSPTRRRCRVLTPPAVSTSATTNTPLAAPVTDLHITKTNGVDGVVAGLPTTYTITVTNPLGPSDAIGATVTDTFPATLTGVTWTCTGTGGGACPASGSGNINTSVTVPVGASVVFTATGTVDPAATGELVNSAQVLPPRDTPTGPRRSPPTAIPSTPRPTWRITKTGPASIVAGNPLVYTITVTNTGPSDAAGVVVNDPTPTGLAFVSNTGDCTTAFPCALGVVPAGATRTITATFTVPLDVRRPSDRS